MKHFGIPALAIAIGLAAAPRVQAQTARRADVLVCRDGTTLLSRDGRVCANHRGVDANATARARRDGVYGANRSTGVYNQRGVYSGAGSNGTGSNGTRGVYDGRGSNG